MEEFIACFAEVVDPRQNNARHDLHELLVIALCTILTGGIDCSDMALFGEVKKPFLRQFLRLRQAMVHWRPSLLISQYAPTLALPFGSSC
jgi:hypothetical protein